MSCPRIDINRLWHDLNSSPNHPLLILLILSTSISQFLLTFHEHVKIYIQTGPCPVPMLNLGGQVYLMNNMGTNFALFQFPRDLYTSLSNVMVDLGPLDCLNY